MEVPTPLVFKTVLGGEAAIFAPPVFLRALPAPAPSPPFSSWLDACVCLGGTYCGRVSWVHARPPIQTKSCWGCLTSWGHLKQDGDGFYFLLPDEFELPSFSQKVMVPPAPVSGGHVGTTSVLPGTPSPAHFCPILSILQTQRCHHPHCTSSRSQRSFISSKDLLAPVTAELCPGSPAPILPFVLPISTKPVNSCSTG